MFFFFGFYCVVIDKRNLSKCMPFQNDHLPLFISINKLSYFIETLNSPNFYTALSWFKALSHNTMYSFSWPLICSAHLYSNLSSIDCWCNITTAILLLHHQKSHTDTQIHNRNTHRKSSNTDQTLTQKEEENTYTEYAITQWCNTFSALIQERRGEFLELYYAASR